MEHVYFMEPEITYEWNIRARVLNEDGSTNCPPRSNTSLPFWRTYLFPLRQTGQNADAPSEEWGVSIES